jgi:hypothetical protein
VVTWWVVAEAQQTGTRQPGPAAEQASPDSSKWLSTTSALIAVAVFFFGAGNFTDLRDKLTQKNRIHSAGLAGYRTLLTSACSSGPGRPDGYAINNLSRLNSVLKARITFVGIWTSSVLDDRLTDAERADMAAARFHFRAATGFWAALTSDFKADDDSAYDAHLGEYWQAMADYVSILHRYGLHSGCAVAWPAPSTLTPPS